MIGSDPLKKNNVTVTGSTSAMRTMIFAHGFGTDQTAWAEMAEAFLADYRVILYDNVGGGRTEPAAFQAERYSSLEAYADDLLEIGAALRVRDAVMVGHSMSAMIGVLAAIREPRYFSRLVLVGASARYRNEDGYHGGFDQADLDAIYAICCLYSERRAPVNPAAAHGGDGARTRSQYV